MADLTTTQLKLRTTPTAGVDSEQSPYYRRLLSAGYKGFLQGTVGGSTLYGFIGAAIGGLVALPIMLAVPTVGLAALALVPAMAGVGLYKGAATFGNIGSFAAITAESAEMSEKRRYLLDRYYDLPDSPAFDDEAEQIRNLLSKQHESRPPGSMFHWRTVAVGAAIGAAVALLFTFAFPGVGVIAAEAIGGHFMLGHALSVPALAGFSTAIGTALGALAGGMIGLDRYYVRGWLDGSAKLMHDSKGIEEQIYEREREIEQLGARAQGLPAYDKATSSNPMKISINDTQQPARAVDESHPHGTTTREAPLNPRQIAGLSEAPTAVAAHAQHEGRISADQALSRPVL